MSTQAQARNQVPSTKVITGKVRFSYLNAFQPRAIAEGQDPKYSVCLLIPKTDKQTVTAIRNAMEVARAEQRKTAPEGKRSRPRLKSPLHDGDGPMPNGGEYGRGMQRALRPERFQ